MHNTSIKKSAIQKELDIFKMFNAFVHQESFSGLLLLVFAVVAIVWANTSYFPLYDQFWHLDFSMEVGSFHISKPLHFWINDVFMALFFFVVGLEIKREILIGELTSLKQAALPIMAAVGGMLVPAIIFLIINRGDISEIKGWGIPTVTDIAFSLAVLSVIGSRVPIGLKIFLAALAIVDDLGAIILIAIFYSTGFVQMKLLSALIITALLLIINRLGIKCLFWYALLGCLLLLSLVDSGIHSTIAGVILALTIPARSRVNAKTFEETGSQLLDDFRKAEKQEGFILTNKSHLTSVQALKALCEKVVSPLQKSERLLHPWSAFFVLPLFAISNAGVDLRGVVIIDELLSPLALGIILGILLGKQIGITFFSWLAIKFNLASLPSNVKLIHVYGVSWLAAIGFTMSLYIANLAFYNSPLLPVCKVAILFASLAAGLIGYLILRTTLKINNGH